MHRAYMTPRQFRAARRTLGFTQQRLAEALGTHFTTIFRWEQGRVPIRESAARLLTRLVEEAGVTRPAEHSKGRRVR